MAGTNATTADARPLEDLNGFRRDMLRTVAAIGPAKGLAMKDALQDDYESRVRHGRAYPALDELVEKGLVSKRAEDDRENAYSVTTEGKRALAAHARWVADAADGRML